MKNIIVTLMVIFVCALYASPLTAEPVGIWVEDLWEQDVLSLEGNTHELGDNPPFPPEELIVSSWIYTEVTACDGEPGDNSSISNVLVTMKNLTQTTWCHVHYVADPETTITNYDGLIGNAGQADGHLAFKIDRQGMNQPLVSEDMHQDECFEPGETWQFIIQDYQNQAGGSATPFGSIGICSNSQGLPSTGSIIALPEDMSEELDFGDAPEGGNALAYPSGVVGSFPTCITVGPNAWIQHGLGWAHFAYQTGLQPPWDGEADGNAGLCPGCFPSYDDDECYLDGDAGLMFPEPFTIDATGGVVTCPSSTGTSLGQTCATAVWGVDVDIWVVNNMPVDGRVNVLMDWDQNGQWQGSSQCPAAPAPEHVLVDFIVPVGFNGQLSSLGPPSFIIGPNSGYVWSRFSITESPVINVDWDGSGTFEDGESEDYLLLVDPSTSSTIPTVSEWGMIVFFILLVGSALLVIRRRTGKDSA